MSINKPKYNEILWELPLAPAGGEHVSWAIYGNLCSKKIRIHDNFSLTRSSLALAVKLKGLKSRENNDITI